MAGLKELKIRIASIKSTQKITSAMKMVAAARLHKLQIVLTKSMPYMNNLVYSAARVLYAVRMQEAESGTKFVYPKLMLKHDKEQKYLLLVYSSDQGLCGNYNMLVAKATMARIDELVAEGKEVKVKCYGRKAYQIIKRTHKEYLDGKPEVFAKKDVTYYDGKDFALDLIARFNAAEFDVCETVATEFVSAITRKVRVDRLIPVDVDGFEYNQKNEVTNLVGNAFYDFDPSAVQMLETLLPLVVTECIYRAAINSQTSEHGARMTSMDNATRNAHDMIQNLTLKYNRLRQTAITTELVEIISGAEAL